MDSDYRIIVRRSPFDIAKEIVSEHKARKETDYDPDLV